MKKFTIDDILHCVNTCHDKKMTMDQMSVLLEEYQDGDDQERIKFLEIYANHDYSLFENYQIGKHTTFSDDEQKIITGIRHLKHKKVAAEELRRKYNYHKSDDFVENPQKKDEPKTSSTYWYLKCIF